MTKTIIPADKPLLVWHFLRQNWETDSGSIKTKIGETYHVKPPIEICSHGLHGSRKVLDSLANSTGPILTLCEVWGEFDEQSDKVVAEFRRPLWGKDISPELNEWACCNAEVALLIAEVDDPRSWKAIEAKRAWLRGEISDKELNWNHAKALAATKDATHDATWAATWSATWAAARNADRDAAWDATWAAAWAAARNADRDAAWNADRDAVLAVDQAAAEDAQQIDLESRMVELLPEDIRSRYIESRKQ